MDTINIYRLATYMDKLPAEKFDQWQIASKDGRPRNLCGHAIALLRPGLGLDAYSIEKYCPFLAAREALGLDGNNPEHELLFEMQWNCTPTPQQAAEVLRHLARTGAADWDRVLFPSAA